jgi:hypothetical protein
VTNKLELWMLHRRSKTYHLRPRAELGIEDPLLAYQFNRVVEMYGHRVDQYLAKKKIVGKGAKAKKVSAHTLEEALEYASLGKRRVTKTSGLAYIAALFANNPGAKRITI